MKDLESKAPVTRDTIFRIASTTQPIAGVAMMMLWEEGKWSLDMMQNVNGSRSNGGSPQVRPLSRQLVDAALVDPKK